MMEKNNRKTFVENGQPVGILGATDHRCQREGNAFVVLPDERWGNPVFGDACLDDSDFHIHAKLTLDRLVGTGVSILIGGHYHYNWSRPDGNMTFRICLDEDIHPGRKAADKVMCIVHGRTDPHRPWSMPENLHEKVVVGNCKDFFQPGEPFTVDLYRRGEELICNINAKEAFRTTLSDDSRISPGRCGDAGWPISVGFLPARGTLRIHNFYAEGSFPGPAFSTTDIWHHNTDGYATYRIPSLCVTPGGRLLAFSEARRSYLSRGWQWHMMQGTELLSGELHCAMKSSDDGGRTWSEQLIIPGLKRGATYQARDPSPLSDFDTGEIFLFTRGPYVVSSKDDGRSWSTPRSLADSLPGQWDSLTSGTGNSAIQLRRGKFKGRLVAALYGKSLTAMILSDDHGATWYPGALAASCNSSEPSILELSDGRLLVSPRHGAGKGLGRLFLTSDDGGLTFGDKRYEPTLLMSGQGEILASEPIETTEGKVRPIICCGPTENKTRLTLMGSLDDGLTWPITRVIDDGSAANLALAALPGGDVGVLYERDKYRRLCFQQVDMAAIIEQAIIEQAIIEQAMVRNT